MSLCTTLDSTFFYPTIFVGLFYKRNLYKIYYQKNDSL